MNANSSSASGARADGRRTALLLGATGLVGAHALQLLLADDRYVQVRALVRRPLELTHPRLASHTIDFDAMAASPELFDGVDDVYCCLGTTIAKAGSQAAFRRVDMEYPVHAAGLAAERGATRSLVVSALGADAGSRIFYNRVKGEMEEVIRRVFPGALWIVRPSLLLGSREEPRAGERIAIALSRPISPMMVGPLRRWRPVLASDVAAAMLRLAWRAGPGGVVESEEIPVLAKDSP